MFTQSLFVYSSQFRLGTRCVDSLAKEIAVLSHGRDPNDVLADEDVAGLAQVLGAMQIRNIRSSRDTSSTVLQLVYQKVRAKGIHRQIASKQLD